MKFWSYTNPDVSRNPVDAHLNMRYKEYNTQFEAIKSELQQFIHTYPLQRPSSALMTTCRKSLHKSLQNDRYVEKCGGSLNTIKDSNSTYMSRNQLLKLTGSRAEFDFFRFLKAHKEVLDITDELAEQVSTTLRMTHTSDLVYIKDKSYLKPLTFLNPTQMTVLWQLVQEVQHDPAYTQNSSKRQLKKTKECFAWLAVQEAAREPKKVARTKLKDRVRRPAAHPTEEERHERRENWQRHAHELQILLAQLHA
jgi:hypothetical protein